MENQIPVADHRPRWHHLKTYSASEALVDEIEVGADPIVNEAVCQLKREVEIMRIVQAAKPVIDVLRTRRGLKVNLGCGADVRAGWMNIDLVLGAEPLRGGVALNFDLRRGLPLAEDSCILIYSSHFLEHLDYRHGVQLMRDCYRCLEVGGTFRLALPDFRKLFTSYVQGDNRLYEEFDQLVGPDFGENFELIRGLEPELRGRAMVDYVNYGVYQYGEHKMIYDEEKLRIVLESVGFRSIAATEFREDLDPGDPLRRNYSFYVEALK